MGRPANISAGARLLRAPTLGQELRRLDLDALSLRVVRYPGGARFAPHAHDRDYVCVLLGGAFEERHGAAAGRDVTSGGFVLMPAGTEHSERFAAGGARAIVVTLAGASAAGDAPRVARPTVLQQGEANREALALCRAFLATGAAAALAIEEHLEAALVAAADGEPDPVSDQRLADRARDVLAVAGVEPVRLAAVATTLGCTPEHLARSFRKRHRCTMSAWLRRRRVTLAAQRLADTREPVAAIAMDCGFADQSHLCRVFKREMGVTPRAYRRLTA